MPAHNSKLRFQYWKENKCICGEIACESYGLCHCGCGGEAPISTGNTKDKEGAIRSVAGIPRKFQAHHANSHKKTFGVRKDKGKARESTLKQADEFLHIFTGICACGCGGSTELATRTQIRADGTYKTVNGHPKRYIHLHQKTGSDNENFVEVHVSTKGYVKLYRPDHPRADGRGRVFEHILVMEASIGRHLVRGSHSRADDEVVHHRDENPGNNDISNLQLMSHGDHTKLHRTLA